MPRRLGVAAVFVLAALIGTTSCSGGQSPPPAQTTATPVESSASASPATTSASPSAAPAYKPADASGRAQNVPVPVLPEAAKAETKEGLEAFAKYWFEVLSYGYETGDVSRLDAITAAECQPCANAKKVILSWNEGGKWLIGGTLTTPSVTGVFDKGPDSRYQVAVQARQKAITYMRPDGSVARSDPQPDDTGNLLFVEFGGGAWKLMSIGKIVG